MQLILYIFSRAAPYSRNKWLSEITKGSQNLTRSPIGREMCKSSDRAGQDAPINRKQEGTCPGGFSHHGGHKINIAHFRQHRSTTSRVVSEPSGRWQFQRTRSCQRFKFTTRQISVALRGFMRSYERLGLTIGWNRGNNDADVSDEA